MDGERGLTLLSSGLNSGEKECMLILIFVEAIERGGSNCNFGR